MFRPARAAAILATALAVTAAPALAKVPPGIWQNPKGSVRVQFRQCGPAMCGRIVWASPEAQAKADAGGGGRLVGADLFQGFEPQGPNQWAGSVLVPDIGQTIQGTITQTSPTTLVGEGCLFAGYGCKEQEWTQVSRGK